MPIPKRTLNIWSQHCSNEASIQAHQSIRGTLNSNKELTRKAPYVVLLQGSYENDTNLRQDSDVDVVVQLNSRVRPKVVLLSSSKLERSQSHKDAYERWQSFRDNVEKTLRMKYGKKSVTSGRKCLRVEKGILHTAADVVVTLRYKDGIAFYLPDERRWVTSYPQQHCKRGRKKEKGTNGRYKKTTRMFKAAKNHLVEKKMLVDETAPSYFIECLLYNVPNEFFKQDPGQSYSGIVDYLSTAPMQQFKCQNELRELFGSSKDLWSIKKARKFIRALKQLWNTY